MIPVILSGGSGTRLWPLSRSLYPKQFLALNSDYSLFQETAIRAKEVSSCEPIIVCNEDTRFTVGESLQDVGIRPFDIILEPFGRNTAPAIAIAAMAALKKEKDPILLVLPSDHLIKDKEAFASAVNEAEKLAKKNFLVTFGIKPSMPHTGYGYIESGNEITKDSFKIKSFKEKPDLKTAKKFIKEKNFFWNSGMFIFKAQQYLKELKKNNPDIATYAKSAFGNATHDMDFIRLEAESFAKCENISIDYAVMEKTKNSAVVKLDANWNDIGSWSSLWDVSQKDDQNNVCKGDIIAKDCKDSYFYSDDKLIAGLSLENIIVVNTKDAVLVAEKSEVENVKKIVEELKKEQRTEHEQHRVVYRPWGHYDSICKGERDQVKRITVKPGAKLSIQMHNHRSEHWVVVKGTAKVTKGEETIMLTENESVYIPLGVKHSLENCGKIPLEIIEVQTGSYLGEDDIVRFEDLYGRT